MAKLTTAARKRIPTKDFALPGERKYPIEDRAHAANAKARVAQHGTPAEKAEVDRKVAEKYPGMGKEHESMREDRKDERAGERMHERGVREDRRDERKGEREATRSHSGHAEHMQSLHDALAKRTHGHHA